MARTRTVFTALKRRGPHQVLRGDLAFAGIPGVVYTPAAGYHLPGVAFGHEWLTDVGNYGGTLEHLASWGIVAAAPDTQRGPAPSVLGLSHDLTATLDVISGVRLGTGQISVAAGKLGLAGHGFGGSAAVLAASGTVPPTAVAAVFPSTTKPSARAAAATLQVPGMVLATPDDATSLRTDALEVGSAWTGAVVRTVDKATAGGLTEKRRIAGMLGLPGSSTRTQRTVRALLTGFLLFHLAGDKAYRAFADPDADLPHTGRPDPDAPPVTDEDRIVALFR
ncbi:MAG: dienelactone hydrolase family protein [Actinomycetia bacterium]|nr:dienelactone hydrolase family protein [Actinomycetes bacterium]